MEVFTSYESWVTRLRNSEFRRHRNAVGNKMGICREHTGVLRNRCGLLSPTITKVRRCSERETTTIRPPPPKSTTSFYESPPFYSRREGRYKSTDEALNASYFLCRLNPMIFYLLSYGSTYDLGPTTPPALFLFKLAGPFGRPELLSY
jgi:hypothetical protein